jgi:hypothetical protein
MALVYEGVKCAICHAKLDLSEPLFATSGVFFPPGDLLHPYCDAPMHWDCYAQWPDRPRFAARYVQSSVEREKKDSYWAKVLLSDNAFVTANPDEPVAEVSIQLFATGSDFRIKLRDWIAWLADSSWERQCRHKIERDALFRVHAHLRSALPTIEAIRSTVDWESKRSLRERRAREQEERERAQREAIMAHNAECHELNLAGVHCPHCGESDITFRDGREEKTSYWQCGSCSRSFRKDDLRGTP